MNRLINYIIFTVSFNAYRMIQIKKISFLTIFNELAGYLGMCRLTHIQRGGRKRLYVCAFFLHSSLVCWKNSPSGATQQFIF